MNLYSVLYGSRLYGTQTPESDKDYIHLVLPDLDRLLRAEKIETKVNKTNNERNTRNSAEDVDRTFIPLQIFARDFLGGQTYALEIAYSSIGISNHAEQTYPEDGAMCDQFVLFTHELMNRFLTSNIKAMVGYAMHQANMYSLRGERVAVIQSVLEVVEKHITADKVSINDHYFTDVESNDFRSSMLALAMVNRKYFTVTTYDAGGGKPRDCFKLLEKIIPFTSSLAHMHRIVTEMRIRYGSRVTEAAVDGIDWKATMHAVRIARQAKRVLTDQRLYFPLAQPEIEYLLRIKRGEVDISVIRDELESLISEIKDLEVKSTLPTAEALREEFNRWLARSMRGFYRIER